MIFLNVSLLSDAELLELEQDFPGKWEYYLDRLSCHIAVSYTHLDVYKRQVMRDDILDVFLEFVQDENHSILMSSHLSLIQL